MPRFSSRALRCALAAACAALAAAPAAGQTIPFERVTDPGIAGVSLSSIALGDLNGDGDLDPLGAGPHTAPIDTARLAAGVYVVRIAAGAVVEAVRLTVAR